MWTYVQRTGELLFNGAHFAQGYSGNGIGKNCPELAGAKGLGPIPCGRWLIVGEPYDSDNTGPFTLRLEPNAGTDTLGRSEFRIHGDSRIPGRASRGCIIMSRPVRTAIWESGDPDLLVVADPPAAPTEQA